MLKAKLLNRTTGERYEFAAADQNEIDAKIAAHACYGRGAWSQTIPAFTDPTTDPPTEHPEQVIAYPAEYDLEIIDMQPEIQQAARDAAVAVVQTRLDTQARAWGYDSILSAVSYLHSSVPQFAAEAATLRDWRDATWATVASAQSTVSSQSELIAMLPVHPARPA
jgi:hypothetical protein